LQSKYGIYFRVGSRKIGACPLAIISYIYHPYNILEQVSVKILANLAKFVYLHEVTSNNINFLGVHHLASS
jgi:hypothetical protein